MEINLGEEKIVELVSPFAEEDINEKAIAKRIDAFGQFAKLLQRPKPDEIVTTKSEKRFEPFWYGAAHAIYRYDRRHRYSVPVAPEVQATTFYEHEHQVQKEREPYFALDAVEHCVEELHRELMLDANRGEEHDYSRFLKFDKRELPDLEALRGENIVVVSPEIRGSFVVRKLAQLLMKTFQADQIFEERIDVEEIVLYCRPIYAFEYYWKSKDKRSVVEFDALTGDIRAAEGQIKKQVVSVLENDALFDIGADTVGMVVPGANIAVKLGRLAARKALK